MSFNLDPTKQAQEVIFSTKITPQEFFQPNLYFNKFVLEKVQTQEHLGLIVDKKLSFKDHPKHKFAKVNKAIGILKKLCGFLRWHSIIALCKSFIWPNLDFGDIIYDQSNMQINIYNKHWNLSVQRYSSYYQCY